MRVDSPRDLALGLGSGLVFGALLEKGGAARYENVQGQLLLMTPRVAQLMATAIAVGGIGVHALERAGLAHLSVKPLRPRALVAGGTLFGAGLALLGYCPGTTVAAAGAGRRDALVGVAGMLTGAIAFTQLHPYVKRHLDADDRGAITLPSATRTAPWPWLAALAAGAAFSWARARRSRRGTRIGSRTARTNREAGARSSIASDARGCQEDRHQVAR